MQYTSNAMSRKLNILHCLDCEPYIKQPKHNWGHSLDLVITNSLLHF